MTVSEYVRSIFTGLEINQKKEVAARLLSLAKVGKMNYEEYKKMDIYKNQHESFFTGFQQACNVNNALCDTIISECNNILK